MRGHSTRTFNAEHDKTKKESRHTGQILAPH